MKIYKSKETAPPFYQRYLDLVPDDGNLLIHLQDIFADTEELVNELPPEKLVYAYAEGKWTIKDILVHLCDAERIFVYRALRIARADQTPLPGFEEEQFARYARANERQASDIIREFSLVRESSIAFIESLDAAALARVGTANNFPVSVNQIINLIYGHHKHHINIIHERYLKA
ncbi:MAG TPA: DinB family protein [Puia sp.]|nr:DinB family protein [Puia sp.]